MTASRSRGVAPPRQAPRPSCAGAPHGCRRSLPRASRALVFVVGLAALLAGACGDSDRPAPSPPAPDRMLAPDEVRAVVADYVRAWNTRDRTLYVSLFAPGGTVEDPVGTPPISGPEALGAFFDGIVASTDLLLEVRPEDLRIAGNHVAFPFLIRLRAGGAPLLLSPVDTMDLDGDAKIVALRAYYSPSDLKPAP